MYILGHKRHLKCYTQVHKKCLAANNTKRYWPLQVHNKSMSQPFESHVCSFCTDTGPLCMTEI